MINLSAFLSYPYNCIIESSVSSLVIILPFDTIPVPNEKDIEKIQQAILDIGNTKEGKAWLSKIPVKKIGKASLDDYLPLGEMGLEEFYVK